MPEKAICIKLKRLTILQTCWIERDKFRQIRLHND
jgi:hypothetical protein